MKERGTRIAGELKRMNEGRVLKENGYWLHFHTKHSYSQLQSSQSSDKPSIGPHNTYMKYCIPQYNIYNLWFGLIVFQSYDAVSVQVVLFRSVFDFQCFISLYLAVSSVLSSPTRLKGYIKDLFSDVANSLALIRFILISHIFIIQIMKSKTRK